MPKGLRGFQKKNSFALGKKFALGYKHTQKAKDVISKTHKGKKKPYMSILMKQNNPMKKGIKYRFKKYIPKKSEKKHLDTTYKYWMLEVKKRDGWKCRLLSSDCKGRLESHHIFNWNDYPELRYILTNGITLCAFHHPRGRENEKRMIPIFQELLSVSKE